MQHWKGTPLGLVETEDFTLSLDSGEEEFVFSRASMVQQEFARAVKLGATGKKTKSKPAPSPKPKPKSCATSQEHGSPAVLGYLGFFKLLLLI
jgi:hypothetical protein